MSSKIEIFHHSPNVEALVARSHDIIGADLPGHRSHVYRTLTYAMHVLAPD